ncbi:MAG: rhomboid family intramembrane serine protease [Candidatus Lokiarchaeota archaeon]|jgi:rhomboid protease GluP|nr:rhomboid family intramembrane serine protease [Candidatus Lokiarchaeota archaeon]
MFILDASNFKKARITIFLISINTLLYVYFSFDFEDILYVFYLLVQKNSKIINDLEIWRLFTSMFLHGDVLHLFSNMVSLLIFGAYVELSYSNYQFLILYFVSGLIGSFFSMLFLPLDVISLGASGAIFGLIGAAFSILIVERNAPLILLGLFYVFYFVFSSFSPGINAFAHIFGLLGGLMIGYLFKRNKKPATNY